jgi:hypothetical protein
VAFSWEALPEGIGDQTRTGHLERLAAIDHDGSNTCSVSLARSVLAQNYRRRVVDSPSMRRSSSSVREKPKTSKLAAIRSGVADLGITTTW